MKYIFIGNKALLDKYIVLFPQLKDHIPLFIECSNEDMQTKANEYVKQGFYCVLVADNTLQNKCVSLSNYSFIMDFVIKKIVDSDLMPSKVRIEASTLCQLNCKGCYMRLHNYGTVGRGYLKYRDFKRFIDCHPYIREVELSNSGEIFLNPELNQIMEYAYINNVSLTAKNGVNFNNVTPLQLDALVKYGFSYLMISIDGASDYTYKKYRRNGDYRQVIKNIQLLQRTKEKYGSIYPKIVWQYIIMPETEKDISLAKKTAKELCIPIWFKLTWDETYVPNNLDYLHAETGLTIFNRREYLFENHKVYLGYETCSQMFFSPQINWDGRLLGCCELFTNDYGINVFEVGLPTALKQPIFMHAKQLLLDKKCDSALVGNIPCRWCKKYEQKMLVNEKFNLQSSILKE